MNTRHLNIKVSDETHRTLKVLAAQNGNTVQEIVAAAINKMLEARGGAQ